MQSLALPSVVAGVVNRYLLAGLTIDSELALPELLPAAHGPAHVTIQLGSGLRPSPDMVNLGQGWWVGPTACTFAIPDVGRYGIRDGAQIFVEPVRNCDPAAIRLYLLGSALGVLFHQRGLLPLHAGGVKLGGDCIAFGGDSGAGKSTLGAYLRRRGYRSLADDVLVVDMDCREPLVGAGYPQTKLWADTARSLGIELAGCARVDRRVDKYYVEIDRETSFCAEPLRLRRLYVLAESDAAPCITRLGNSEALAELTRNTYRPFLLEPMGRWPAHFAACATLVRRVGVYRLSRRRDLSAMDAVVDLLVAHSHDASI